MKPERWQEIVRLYYAALERKPEERAACIREGCAGNDSLRKEVESLLACRPEAEKFLESPGLEAAHEALAGNQPPGSAGINAHRVNALTQEDDPRPGRQRVLPPWWIWLMAAPIVTCAGFLYFWLFFGPEPVGWMMEQDTRASSRGWHRITGVHPQSAAARAGFRSGDLITSTDLDRLHTHPHTGQFRFQVEGRGKSTQLTLTIKRRDREFWQGSEGIRELILCLNSVLYLVLAGILILVRPRDSMARWGAILLAQLGVQMLLMVNRTAGSPFIFQAAHLLRTLPVGIGPVILLGMSIAMMVASGALGFLAGFPRTPLKGVWLWLLVWAPGIVAVVPIVLRMFWLPVYAGASGPVVPGWLFTQSWVIGVCRILLAIVLLTHNWRQIEDRNERRRLRLVAAGFGISVFTMAVRMAVNLPWGPMERFRYGYWLVPYFESGSPLLYAFAPVCAAYAILRQRMFDIHVMVRLGLRYAAARGLLLSIIPTTGLVLALDLLAHGNQPLVDIVRHRGLLYAAIALGAFLLHVRQKTWLNAIDRRFFREHYDARRLLGEVVDDVRRATTFEQAASQVISKIEAALHPGFAGILVRQPGAANFCAVASVGGAPPPIPADSILVALMKASNKPIENSQSQPGRLHQELPREEVECLQKTGAEWFFPLTLGGTGPEAILVLGAKRSEEPYSQEDREILSVIAGSLALLLERSKAAAPPSVGFGECPECGSCYDSGVAYCETDGGGLSTSPFSLTLAQRYRFERRLGRGGMGTVYQARDAELQRLVAVKVIRPELMPGTDALARFRWEAKAAAGFVHQNVVTVHDFGVAEDNRAYLVMELLGGCSLRQELVRCGRLEPNRVLEILSGVSSAIEAAHDRRLLHRDLKPENIFLSRSGSAEVAKVLDFGLAKLLTHDTGMEGMEGIPSTAHGLLIGTLPYMSPERIRGGTPMESWDIWALAVMAFEMLTGVHPFGTLTAWGSMVVEDRFPPLEDNAPALPPQLQQFFRRSLAVDGLQRPRSARHFNAQLQTALQQLSHVGA